MFTLENLKNTDEQKSVLPPKAGEVVSGMSSCTLCSCSVHPEDPTFCGRPLQLTLPPIIPIINSSPLKINISTYKEAC